jgi:hypothetical protein
LQYDPVVTTYAGVPQQRNYVRFYHRQLKSDALSAEEKRPVFESVEYIKINVPGDKTMEVDCRVTDNHRQEYEPEYKAFLAQKDQNAARGTPLDMLGLIPERVAEYQYHKVFTIEQLANVSDGNVQSLGMGVVAERQKARDYLAVMKGDASIQKMRSEVEELKAQLAAVLAAKEAPKPEHAEKHTKK